MNNDGPRLTVLGKLFVLLLVAGSVYGAWLMFTGRVSVPGRGGVGLGLPTAGGVRIGVAYGTEKERWLKWAAAEFAAQPEGRGIQVELIPMGSLEGAQALVDGDKRITVWSPASSLYLETFLQDWKVKYSTEPIAYKQELALTPMVFVMWEERYQQFVKRFGQVSHSAIARALAAPGGWGTIAGRPEWGLFKYGHTHPNQSNSGLMTLVLMAYNFYAKDRGLSVADITNERFQRWLQQSESAVSGLPNSTGNLIREMVLKGPSSYDAVFVYESVAIDYLKNAEGRWGSLRVVYPRRTMWNDNPYYIIKSPWASEEQLRAARTFLDFLMSGRVQKQALVHGFRPGDPNVAVKSAGSPFLLYKRYGLRVDVTTTCQPPSAEVLTNLLASWQRTQGPR